jgi:hypothetical protein
VLITYVGDHEWTRVVPPVLGDRAWGLCVVALQLSIDGGEVRGQLRARVTGREPEVRQIAAPTIVHVQLAPTALPRLTAPPGLSVFLDGERLHTVEARGPDGARAFAHAFCRYLREGGLEPGFDLCAFQSPPPGVQYERALLRPLAAGQTVSYAWI